ncbi:MAG: dihydroorotate dehydrogenase-like protein [Bacteroidota bacterium]
MADLSVNYMGLKLKNPIIAGSSGLMNSIRELKEVAEHGAGAVVLKSIFEEQIRHETEKMINEQQDNRMAPMQKGLGNIMDTRPYDFAEALDYISNFAKEHTLNEYLNFITEAKKAIDIPVIASINCVTPYDWHYFARRIQAAGADAIELNIYILPSNPEKLGADNEKVIFEVAEAVRKMVSIPVSVKVSYYYSGLAHTMVELSNSGIKGLVLFNRPFHPDININTLELTTEHLLSDANEYSHTLRWMAILAGRVGCDLVASTGIHNYESAVKQILAGATAVQMVSAIYKNGASSISDAIKGMESWMDSKGFKTVADFRGKLSQVNIANPAEFERVQFMKLYSKIV